VEDEEVYENPSETIKLMIRILQKAYGECQKLRVGVE
jgi:hypothetical protein